MVDFWSQPIGISAQQPKLNELTTKKLVNKSLIRDKIPVCSLKEFVYGR